MRNILLVASCAVVASGCASTSSPYVDNTDVQKIRAVERVARVNGVEVHWINYPQQRPLAVETAVPAAPPTGT